MSSPSSDDKSQLVGVSPVCEKVAKGSVSGEHPPDGASVSVGRLREEPCVSLTSVDSGARGCVKTLRVSGGTMRSASTGSSHKAGTKGTVMTIITLVIINLYLLVMRQCYTR